MPAPCDCGCDWPLLHPARAPLSSPAARKGCGGAWRLGPRVTSLFESRRRHFGGRALCAAQARRRALRRLPPLRSDRERILIVNSARSATHPHHPILHHLHTAHPHAHLTWITHSPVVPPRQWIASRRSRSSILRSRHRVRSGAELRQGPGSLCARIPVPAGAAVHARAAPAPADAAAALFLTGIFDDVSRSRLRRRDLRDRGLPFAGEYMDPPGPGPHLRTPAGGPQHRCGGRWVSRLWPGPTGALAASSERARWGWRASGDEKNRRLRPFERGQYRVTFHCPVHGAVMDLVVSAVTMAMHLAIGLKKPLILFNIFVATSSSSTAGEILQRAFPALLLPAGLPQNCMQYTCRGCPQRPQAPRRARPRR